MHKGREIHNIVVLGNADLHPETKRVSPAWAPVQQTGKSHPIHLPRFLAEKKKPVAVLLRKITETDCRGRMCGARLAGNRNSNWANKFLARALS
ncbi:unnamed protein product [Leuciscus chuanchicus]